MMTTRALNLIYTVDDYISALMMYYHERIPEIAYSAACMGKEPHGTT